FNIPANNLARLIQMTSFSMSNDETRYNLNGIHLNFISNARNNNTVNLTAAATDAHRLSVAVYISNEEDIDHTSQEEVNNNSTGVIIPRKTINELIKLLKDSKYNTAEINIFISENKIKFDIGNVVLISKVIDGDYPDYNSFIPKNNENILVINKSIFKSAIERAFAVTEEKFRAVTMSISPERNIININASGVAKGVVHEDIYLTDNNSQTQNSKSLNKAICSYVGTEVKIGFNPRYVTDVLHEIKSETISLHLKDSFSPILIKDENNIGDSFVIMPVKV
ncbi:MAG TPA: DNA polymerase III subunit beta, partial [Candidatus Megaira endosymbiont of Hartmannula sinica]|nr:DNA polymerase III subunit beta [Candidatus Megaera endosymbiont of Hartmannula sinica]